jgi:DNA-binding CsgD family transcriptional regulator
MRRLATAKPLGVNIAPNVNISPTAMRSVITREMPAHGRWMLRHLIECGTTLPGPVTMLAPGEPFPKKFKGTFISATPNEPDETSEEVVSALPTQLGCESGGRKEDLETPRQVHLTDRQLEAARLVATGLSNKEAGNQMGISERGVKTHLQAIGRKANIRGRVQIAMWYMTQHFPKV